MYITYNDNDYYISRQMHATSKDLASLQLAASTSSNVICNTCSVLCMAMLGKNRDQRQAGFLLKEVFLDNR